MFPDALIEQIRDRAIEVYEAELAQEIDTTRDPNAICPFHPDKNPSLYVNPDGLWYCQPCGQGGDVFGFIQKRRKVYEFPNAVKIAAEILGIPLPERRSGYSPDRDIRAIRRRANAKRVRAIVKDWYSTRLKELVVSAHNLERLSRDLWAWGLRNGISKSDSIWDKCIRWSSEAKIADEERKGLEMARGFEAQLVAFEEHYKDMTPRVLSLSREEWENVRRLLVKGVASQDGRGDGASGQGGPGLFSHLARTPKGDHHPEHLEEGEDECDRGDRPDCC